MNEIKLVIWDLDETFWKGTFSEGPVKPVHSNIDLVKTLTKRGIIHSISSKNDYEPCKEKLKELQVWEYFVFPIINWNPKGENVRRIIEKCQLRPQNVLFIDDNASNLNEVEYYNRGIQTLDASKIDTLLDDPRLKGKDDKEQSRLKQYKILEKKDEYREQCSDNHEFLMQSDIRVEFIRKHELAPYVMRVVELIHRANQMNFTKVRIGEEELKALISQPEIEASAIKVTDKFGDYGICGFYASDTKQNKLVQFLFSCRILNLGVDSYIYQKLGCPKLEIVEPVSSKLDADLKCDWIHEKEASRQEATEEDAKEKKTRLMLVGGCDLDQLCHYIDTKRFDVITDFNYVNAIGNPVHREHTCFIRMHEHITDADIAELAKLPFLDEQIMNYQMFTEQYDVFIYSVLMNYTQELYRNKKNGLIISYGGYNNILNDKSVTGFTPEQLAYFKENYEYVGQQTKEALREDLEYLYQLVKKPILFINGAEIEIDNPLEKDATAHHQEMNEELDEFIRTHADRCKLVDVRKAVHSRSDVEDNIRHYERIIYVELAEQIMEFCGTKSFSWWNRVEAVIVPCYEKCVALYRKIKKKLKKVVKKIYGK